MNTADWKCPVCSFYAQNGDEQDRHMQYTGHLTQGTTEDAGISHPHTNTEDMSYSVQFGYAPGASNQIDSSEPQDKQSNIYPRKNRV
ncbi:MAG TPA: hypothetical protein VN711_02355 [Candidatus Saccharimonadales bacterium]|nr:hypothetical protein [Candidatus Saccharimonadales bacterium]